MKFSPCYLLYNRDIVLPLGNILKPRRLYYGGDHHNIALQEQHRTFTPVRNNLKKAGKRMKERSNDVDFKVGMSWGLYYVVIEKTGPISYKIKDQLTISVDKAMLKTSGQRILRNE